MEAAVSAAIMLALLTGLMQAALLGLFGVAGLGVWGAGTAVGGPWRPVALRWVLQGPPGTVACGVHVPRCSSVAPHQLADRILWQACSVHPYMMLRRPRLAAAR